MGGILRTLLAAFVLLLTATTTAQAQWEIEDSHTTASLRGIHNVGGGVAWASGTGGTVLRTLDDGKTWQTCPIPLAGTKDTAEKLDFRGIQAFDAQTAIVMSSGPGDQSRLYKTTDGCQTWKLLFTNPDKDGFWDALQVSPDDGGVVIGDPVNGKFVIYETHDKGESWEAWAQNSYHDRAAERVQAAIAKKGESLFAASNSSADLLGRNIFCFVTGGTEGASLLASEAHNPFDNGTTYKFARIKLPFSSGASSGAFSVADRANNAARGAVDLMIVGGDYSTPNIAGFAAYVEHRSGRSKIVSAQTPPHGYRSAVAYDPNKKTWITVGPNGTDISTDDGRNWRPLTPTSQDAPDADKNWNALSLPFVVGPKGRIGKLRNTALGSVRMVKPGAR
jgi:hypothetical protein